MVLSLTAVALTLVPLAPLPRQDKQKAQTVLSSSDHKSLNTKVQKWFDLWKKHNDATRTKDRVKLAQQKRKARESFDKDFKKKTAKKNVMSSIPDLEAIFRNAFAKSYKRISASGEVKVSRSYSLVAPRGYDPKKDYRMILAIPGYAEDKWQEAKTFFDAAWKGYSGASNTVFVMPDLEETGEDYDSSVNFSMDGEIDNERLRLSSFLMPCGEIQRSYNIDRQRFFLDCGQGSTYFGLRLATYFPTRFAGLIVRWPAAVDEIRLASLGNLPILLVKSDKTAADCDLLKARIEKAGGKVTVIEAKDAWPFTAAKEEIGKWVDLQRRDLFPMHVHIEPNHDRFHNAYWVKMGTAEALDSVARDDRPYLDVTADRDNNRITVKTKNVQNFRLDLNDLIVDLSKPFTVEVNGVIRKVEKKPSMRFLYEELQRSFDPNRLFTAEYSTTVPKTEEKESGDKDSEDK